MHVFDGIIGEYALWFKRVLQLAIGMASWWLIWLIVSFFTAS